MTVHLSSLWRTTPRVIRVNGIGCTQMTRTIGARRERVYEALLDPAAVARSRCPSATTPRCAARC
jgi:hypothetical protein